MEIFLMETQKMALNAPNIIKVVNLKRFLPETHLKTKPKLKKTWHYFINPGPSRINEQIIETHNNGTEESVIIDNDPILETINKSSELRKSESCEKQVVASRNKIRFRNCAHSPKELSTLHEHVDDTLVKVGDTFESRDCFKQYLNDNAKRWHYYYVCRNSKKKLIEYNCICMAYKNKEREVVIRRQKKRTTACPCKIRLTVDQITNEVVVYYVCNHHDHETTASAFYHYPHAKYLPQNVNEEFLDLTYLGLDVGLIQKYIHSVIGLTIKKKDIWSYTYRFKRKIFQRSISEERKKYIDDLMISIRKNFGEPFASLPVETTSRHYEEVEGKLKRRKSFPKQETDQTIEIDSLSNVLIMNEKEDELLLRELAEMNDTEIIVQYINEQGILCDENGIPITNSSAIMQFINNYSQCPPDINVTDDFLEQGTILSELVGSIHEELCPIDWETVQMKSVECVGYDDTEYTDNDSLALIETVEESVTVAKEEVDTAIEISDGYQLQRLSPTRETSPVYAEMGNFSRYYYVDHRYIPYRDENSGKEKNIQTKKKHCASNVKGDLISAREEYVKAPDFLYWPTSIRHCTGHEHLTLLTDQEAILPGAKFLNHEVFLTYINERANRWFFYYSLVESGKAPENYVYKCVYGKHRVSKNAYRAKGLRKRNKITTQCPCQIRLRRLESDPDYLTVLFSCNHHDHALDERQFNAQPHSRRLPLHIKEEVKDLLTLNVSADILRKYVAAKTGVKVYGKYFHNVRVAMRRRGEQRHFTEQRLQALTKKIRDLEATFGNIAKEDTEDTVPQIQSRKRKLAPLQVKKEDRFTQVGLEDTATQTLERCELSDKDDFAQEVFIVQTDALPPDTERSRLETRLQNLSHQDILLKVRKLQESVRCDGLRTKNVVMNGIMTP